MPQLKVIDGEVLDVATGEVVSQGEGTRDD